MVREVALRIADLPISVRYSSSTPAFEGVYRHYHDFLTQDGATSPDLCVTVEFGPVPPVNRGARKIFESGSSWELFAEGDLLRMRLNPGSAGECMWEAAFGHDPQLVEMRCDPRFLPSRKVDVPFPFIYPVGQIVLIFALAYRRGLLLHGAGFVRGGGAYLFLGKSGAGKSTLMRQFDGMAGVTGLSDDRMAVRETTDGCFRAYGTPWPGEGAVAVNGSAPLKGMFFLSKAGENRVQRVSRQEAVERLLPVASILWYDEDLMTKNLAFVEGLVENIPAYVLHFRPGPDVVAAVQASLEAV